MKVGEVVIVKGTEQKMTVRAVNEDKITVDYFIGNQHHREDFPLADLEIVNAQ